MSETSESTETPEPAASTETDDTASTDTDDAESTDTAETESTDTAETESTDTAETESTDTAETESTDTAETESTDTAETGPDPRLLEELDEHIRGARAAAEDALGGVDQTFVESGDERAEGEDDQTIAPPG